MYHRELEAIRASPPQWKLIPGKHLRGRYLLMNSTPPAESRASGVPRVPPAAGADLSHNQCLSTFPPCVTPSSAPTMDRRCWHPFLPSACEALVPRYYLHISCLFLGKTIRYSRRKWSVLKMAEYQVSSLYTVQ